MPQAHGDTGEDPHTWSTDQVYEWLSGQPGYGQRCADALLQHEVSGDVLLSLREADLRKPPLELRLLGDIKKLAVKISNLRKKWCKVECGPDCEFRHTDNSDFPRSKSSSFSNGKSRSDSFDDFGDDLIDAKSSDAMKPEIFKTFVSFMYAFAVSLATTFVMTVVHDRVPDMNKYPPLPDIFLDNVPYIPWAFEASEFTITLLSTTFLLVVIFHKHRLVVLRRFFALMGTVFILRCVTMLITSLSVPGAHLECTPQLYPTLWGKIQRAAMIWRGLGMAVAGVRVCGDYMFSGHTVCLTMFTSFITEYTPPKFYRLHTIAWLLTAFGIFFILAGHEHYSIDVFVALYLTSRLFMYYHTLARSGALHNRNRLKTQIWFPLFAYFEWNCEGEIPYEYEFILTPAYKWLCAKLKERKKFE